MTLDSDGGLAYTASPRAKSHPRYQAQGEGGGRPLPVSGAAGSTWPAVRRCMLGHRRSEESLLGIASPPHPRRPRCDGASSLCRLCSFHRRMLCSGLTREAVPLNEMHCALRCVVEMSRCKSRRHDVRRTCQDVETGSDRQRKSL